MPNSANKSKGNSGIAQPKKNSTMPSTEKQGTDNGAKKSDKKATAKSGKGGS